MAINDLEKMDNYNPTNYVNNSEPDIDAEHLNKTENKLEETVEKANEIIDTLKALISTVQTNSQTTVPSSSLVYSMQQAITKNTDDIATANSNLGNISKDLNTVIGDINPLKSNYVSHINVNVLNKVNLVLWDANTADTPFKAGNTVYGNGFCITYSSGVEQWLCQLAMAVGDSHLFTRHQREGVWSGWTTIGSPNS